MVGCKARKDKSLTAHRTTHDGRAAACGDVRSTAIGPAPMSMVDNTAEAASSNHGCFDISHPLHPAVDGERLHFVSFA